MSSTEMAVKNLKTIGTEITQWENRLEFVKTEVQKNTQVRDSLQAEIDKKTADFSIFISQRDAETKNAHTALLQEREQLAKDKTDFMEVLKAHQSEKESFQDEKREFDIQRLKHASTTQNVQEFITAVRRASGLLGI